MAKIYFSREFKDVEIEPGAADLRTVAAREGVEIYRGLHKYLNCRGRGLCGTCLVRVEEQDVLSERTGAELRKIPATDPTARLACQTYAYGDCTVKTYPRVRQGWMEHKVYQHLAED